MIQQGAKKIDPLPNSSGPKTEITPQEKAAAKKLTLAMRYGQDTPSSSGPLTGNSFQN
jgi:hypothetical protein